MFTGTKTATLCSRLPILDVAAKVATEIKPLALEIESHHMGLTTYVDNFLALGRSPKMAIDILRITEKRLGSAYNAMASDESSGIDFSSLLKKAALNMHVMQHAFHKRACDVCNSVSSLFTLT